MPITDYAIIPKADYKAACDKIREYSGKTDVIKSDALASEIEAIAGSGGTSEDVRYVTFIGADGSVLIIKPVAVGDDCADVVARGLIDTPTKESTVAEVYTYSGWSLTSGGSASADALKSVTEDRTVYAAFTAKARTYTVRFYDGDTLMKTQKVAYGTKATPPDTAKEGYLFVAWTPSDLTIYEDTDFVGEWEVDQGWLIWTEVPTISNAIYDMLYSHDGTRLFTAGGGYVRMYDATTKPYTLLKSVSASGSMMAISPDDTMLILCNSNQTKLSSLFKAFSIESNNLKSITMPSTSFGQYIHLSSIGFNATGTKIYGLENNSAYVFELNTSDWSYTRAARLPGNSRGGGDISADGKRLVVPYIGANGYSIMIGIFDIENNYANIAEENPTYLPSQTTPNQTIFSSTERYIAFYSNVNSATSTTKTIRVYDTTTTPYTAVYTADASDSTSEDTILKAKAITFSPDDKIFAVACQTSDQTQVLYCFDTETWTQKDAPMVLPATNAYKVAFNADGTHLAIAGSDSPYLTLYEVKQ